ncbi:MAG: hypothetical protein AAF514_13435 [Verrucomicrobiota bacterium]
MKFPPPLKHLSSVHWWQDPASSLGHWPSQQATAGGTRRFHSLYARSAWLYEATARLNLTNPHQPEWEFEVPYNLLEDEDQLETLANRWPQKGLALVTHDPPAPGALGNLRHTFHHLEETHRESVAEFYLLPPKRRGTLSDSLQLQLDLSCSNRQLLNAIEGVIEEQRKEASIPEPAEPTEISKPSLDWELLEKMDDYLFVSPRQRDTGFEISFQKAVARVRDC